MRNQVDEVSFTKASSKGQVVIPTKMRKRFGIKEGTVFAIAAQNDMIVLKKVEAGLSQADLESLKLVQEAWKDIEAGRYHVRSKQAFLKELKEW